MSARTKRFSYPQALLSLGAGVLAAAGCIALSAAAAVGMQLPQRIFPALAIGSVCLGSLFGAWQLARTRGENGLACGAAAGAVYAAVLLLWAWSGGAGLLNGAVLLRGGAVLLCGIVGGYCGMLTAEKRARRRR